MFGALTLLAFYLGQTMTGELAAGQTMAFIVLSLSQVVQAFNMRSSIRCLRLGRFSNKKLNLAALASLLLVLAVVFTPLMIPFGLVTLTPQLYLIAFGLCLVPLVVMELSKSIWTDKTSIIMMSMC